MRLSYRTKIARFNKERHYLLIPKKYVDTFQLKPGNDIDITIYFKNKIVADNNNSLTKLNFTGKIILTLSGKFKKFHSTIPKNFVDSFQFQSGDEIDITIEFKAKIDNYSDEDDLAYDENTQNYYQIKSEVNDPDRNGDLVFDENIQMYYRIYSN